MKLELEKLNSKDPKIKYGFAKELLKRGKESPAELYYYLDYWVDLMKSENNILKWTAIDLIGYASAVDKENKIDAGINDLIRFLHGGHLITCNHAIFALGLIAKNKPVHREKIISELIAVSDDTFETAECKKIAIGKVILAFNEFKAEVSANTEAIKFIRMGHSVPRVQLLKRKRTNL